MSQTFPVPAVPGFLTWPWRWRVALLVGLALSLSVVPRGQAATTWSVCASGCDYSSIKAAIAAPTTLDGDTLAIAAGTYTEPGITVNKSLTLQGASAARTIVQAAASWGAARKRVFIIPFGVTVTIRELTIRYGYVLNSSGGDLYNSGTLTLTNSTIRSNAAGFGGGFYNSYGTATLTNSTVSDNLASYDGGNVASVGGGLYNDFGTLTLTNSTVSGNAATNGGGLYNIHGPLTLTNSTVSGNAASRDGGGFLNQGTATLTNSTVSGNAASGAGGGLFNQGTATLSNSTIRDNAATNGGGLYNEYGTAMLSNSIIASHSAGGDCRNYTYPGIHSDGYNLDSDQSCLLSASTDRPGVDPLLGPLQDNGGSTLTHALLPGSPAIDAIPWGTNGCGTTLFRDQRLQAQAQPAGGACDIGSYEVEMVGQALGAWVTGFTPRTVVCQNNTTGHSVTLSNPASPWDCEAAGIGVSSGDQVSLRARGPVQASATDVGGAVAGMAPSSGSCTNLMTGQQVPFQHMAGATAASCVVAGLVMHPGDTIQINVRGLAP